MAAQPAPNGIPYPTGWQNWKVIAVSHREDNHTLRVILGNDKAVEAARKGQTNPWPDGAALGKVVWKDAVKSQICCKFPLASSVSLQVQWSMPTTLSAFRSEDCCASHHS